MTRHQNFFVCLGMFALASACTSTVRDTRDADIKAVKAVEAAWVTDIATKDAGKFASYYAEDATLQTPEAPAINGRDNIETAIKPMLADPNFSLTFQASKAEASKGGDFVYTIGRYSMTMSSPTDKKPVTRKGNYLTLYKKQANGNWKAVADMISSDGPVGGERPQAKKEKPHRVVRTHKRARRR
jgi:uncharacterized protein (TIGR02246 family)